MALNFIDDVAVSLLRLPPRKKNLLMLALVAGMSEFIGPEVASDCLSLARDIADQGLVITPEQLKKLRKPKLYVVPRIREG